MKKKYIQPTAKAFSLRVDSILAGSPGSGFDDSTGNGSDEAAKNESVEDFGW